eukprot:926972-Alexandrium_andersonii.AAC.1
MAPGSSIVVRPQGVKHASPHVVQESEPRGRLAAGAPDRGSGPASCRASAAVTTTARLPKP